MKSFVASVLAVVVLSPLQSQTKGEQWETDYEQSGHKKTPRYTETIEYSKRLDAASPWISYMSFGKSPQGRELPLVVLSKEGAFTAAEAKRTGKAIILIQSGIHSGEIDGKDASLMLMRDIAIYKTREHLLDHTVLMFVPIFNVDGHERFSAYNRINQNGPEEMGWRTTAQNLNLNRDYMKADAPEMRAMLRLFSQWLPDFYVDCHVTDGMDFQYDVTYEIETGPNVDPAVSEWVQERLLPASLPRFEKSGHKIFFYVFPREDNDLAKGLVELTTPPRFSTGYGVLQNRPTFLIETHMLKPYRTRVDATYHLLVSMIETINEDSRSLQKAVRAADERTIEAGKVYRSSAALPLRFESGSDSVVYDFLGIRSHQEHSDLSGGEWRVYTGEPYNTRVAFFNHIVVSDSASIPLAYLVPQEWTFVPEVCRAHGVLMEELTEPETLEVQSYRFANVKWRARPFEGRQMATYETTMITERRSYPKGTILIRTAQRAAKVVMNLLEPNADDSFAAWGFFNAIFEQKEYAESYVMEKIGREMLHADDVLKRRFEEKIRTDSTFATYPGARLNWLYLQSPWADEWLNKYPIGRVVEEAHFTTHPLE